MSHIISLKIRTGFQGFISFTLEELKGVPEDVISGYPKRKEGNKELYDVTHKTPDIFPLVCTSHSLFHDVFVSSRSRSSNMRKVRRHVDEHGKVLKLAWS